MRDDGHSGVKAAETGESDARDEVCEGSAREEEVGVAQYDMLHPTWPHTWCQRMARVSLIQHLVSVCVIYFLNDRQGTPLSQYHLHISSA